MQGESITDSGTQGADSGTVGGDTSADTSEHVDTSAGEGGDTGGTDGAASAAQTAAAKKRAVKWLGREMELSEEEMAERFGDDYEWEFHGAAGKPLLKDGKPVKLRWPEIQRHVQKGLGAEAAAQAANKARKDFEDRMAWGKAPENQMAFIERELGVEDVDSWLLQKAAEVFQKKEQLVQLAQQNPHEYERRLAQEFQRKQQDRMAAQKRLQEQQEQGARRAQMQERFNSDLSREFKPLGLPMNSRTTEIAHQILREYKDAGAEMPPLSQLAGFVRDQYHQEIFGYLDGRPDPELLKIFGDKRRERLRKAELEALKLAKKQAAPQPQSQQQRSAQGPRRDDGGMTVDAWLKRR